MGYSTHGMDFQPVGQFCACQERRSVKAVGRAASFHDTNKAFCRFNKASAKLGNYIDDKVGNKCYFSLT